MMYELIKEINENPQLITDKSNFDILISKLKQLNQINSLSPEELRQAKPLFEISKMKFSPFAEQFIISEYIPLKKTMLVYAISFCFRFCKNCSKNYKKEPSDLTASLFWEIHQILSDFILDYKNIADSSHDFYALSENTSISPDTLKKAAYDFIALIHDVLTDNYRTFSKLSHYYRDIKTLLSFILKTALSDTPSSLSEQLYLQKPVSAENLQTSKKILEQFPENFSEIMLEELLKITDTEQKNIAQEIIQIEEAEEILPRELSRLAELYEKAGEYDKALESAYSLFHIDKTHPENTARIFSLELSRNPENAFAICPFIADEKKRISCLHEIYSMNIQKDFIVCVFFNWHYRMLDYETAFKYVREMITLNIPTDYSIACLEALYPVVADKKNALELLAGLYEQSGQRDLAAKCYKNLYSDFKDTTAFEKMSEMLIQSGKTADIKYIYLERCKQNPRDFTSLKKLISILLAEKNPGEAFEYLIRLPEHESSVFDTLLKLINHGFLNDQVFEMFVAEAQYNKNYSAVCSYAPILFEQFSDRFYRKINEMLQMTLSVDDHEHAVLLMNTMIQLSHDEELLIKLAETHRSAANYGELQKLLDKLDFVKHTDFIEKNLNILRVNAPNARVYKKLIEIASIQGDTGKTTDIASEFLDKFSDTEEVLETLNEIFTANNRYDELFQLYKNSEFFFSNRPFYEELLRNLANRVPKTSQVYVSCLREILRIHCADDIFLDLFSYYFNQKQLEDAFQLITEHEMKTQNRTVIEQCLKKLADADFKVEKTLQKLAEILLNEGNFESAADCYRKIIQLYPESSVTNKLITMYASRGQLDSIFEIFEENIFYKEHPEVMTEKLIFLAETVFIKDHNSQISIYEQILKIIPESYPIACKLAELYQNINNIKSLRTLILKFRNNPEFVLSYYTLCNDEETMSAAAQVFEKKKEFRNARILYKKLNTRNPGHYFEKLEKCLFSLKDYTALFYLYKDSEKISELMSLAKICTEEMEFDLAERIIDFLISADPFNIDYLLEQIQICLKTNNFSKAAHLLDVIQNMQLKPPEELIQYYNFILSRGYENEEILFLVAKNLENTEPEKALTNYLKLCTRFPDNPVYSEKTEKLYISLKQFDTLFSFYLTNNAYEKMAKLYETIKTIPAECSGTLLEILCRENPSSAYYRKEYATYLISLRSWHKAEEILRELHNLGAEDFVFEQMLYLYSLRKLSTSGQQMLAGYYCNQKQYDDAVKILHALYKTHPTDSIYVEIAVLYVKQKKWMACFDFIKKHASSRRRELASCLHLFRKTLSEGEKEFPGIILKYCIEHFQTHIFIRSVYAKHLYSSDETAAVQYIRKNIPAEYQEQLYLFLFKKKKTDTVFNELCALYSRNKNTEALKNLYIAYYKTGNFLEKLCSYLFSHMYYHDIIDSIEKYAKPSETKKVLTHWTDAILGRNAFSAALKGYLLLCSMEKKSSVYSIKAAFCAQKCGESAVISDLLQKNPVSSSEKLFELRTGIMEAAGMYEELIKEAELKKNDYPESVISALSAIRYKISAARADEKYFFTLCTASKKLFRYDQAALYCEKAYEKSPHIIYLNELTELYEILEDNQKLLSVYERLDKKQPVIHTEKLQQLKKQITRSKIYQMR